MQGWMIWAAAAALYGAFRLWYENWRGKLTPAEIDRFFAALAGRFDTSAENAANLRAFLANDDGRDFLMFNIVKSTTDPVADPISGESVPGTAMLNRYSRHFLPVLFATGGHPVIARRKIGPYVDAWATEPDPGWTIVSLMRYRSRRDLMKLVLDPRMAKHHPDKIAGVMATFSFPTAPIMQLYAGPRIWVALALALAAALVQLVLR